MILGLDHFVLTVSDLEASVDFYTRVLDMQHISYNGRHAVRFGAQKINLHVAGNEFAPCAARATPGSADFCFLIATTLEDAVEKLNHENVIIEEGPVDRTGATGVIRSVYIRDPDDNLIELSVS